MISGISAGRPLVSKILRMATGFQASAPSPYTVSVGNATTPPRRISSMACCSVMRSPPAALPVWQYGASPDSPEPLHGQQYRESPVAPSHLSESLFTDLRRVVL